MRCFSLVLLSLGLISFSFAQRFRFVGPKLPGMISPRTLMNNVNKAAEDLRDGVENVMNLVQLSPSGANLNIIVDTIIQGLRMSIKSSNLDRVPLPDYNKSLTIDINPDLTLDFSLKADRGYLKDLSTIRRTGNTILSRSGRNLTLTTGFGLDLLEFGYENYEFDSNYFHTRGMVDGKIGSNSATVKLTIRLLGLMNCSVILDDLKIIGFDGLTVKLTGFRDLNQPISMTLTVVLRAIRNIFMMIAEEQANKFLRELLENYACQDIIKLLIPQ